MSEVDEKSIKQPKNTFASINLLQQLKSSLQFLAGQSVSVSLDF